jgi:hypothetical protein
VGAHVIHRLEEQEQCVAATDKSQHENKKVEEALKAVEWIVSRELKTTYDFLETLPGEYVVRVSLQRLFEFILSLIVFNYHSFLFFGAEFHGEHMLELRTWH